MSNRFSSGNWWWNLTCFCPPTALTHSLIHEGYEVHTQVEDPIGPPLEEIEGTDEEREKEFLRRLQAIADSDEPKKALILKNSHIGGHKYSGNVVVSVRLHP